MYCLNYRDYKIYYEVYNRCVFENEYSVYFSYYCDYERIDIFKLNGDLHNVGRKYAMRNIYENTYNGKTVGYQSLKCFKYGKLYSTIIE